MGEVRRAASGSRRSARAGALVGAGRAAEPEIDPAGVQRLQRAELLGDHQRRVVGQHDAAGADADRRRAPGHVADRHRGRRAGDAGHVVVLGQPVADVAPASACRARSREWRNASPGVPPSGTGARSRIESGVFAMLPRLRLRRRSASTRAAEILPKRRARTA